MPPTWPRSSSARRWRRVEARAHRAGRCSEGDALRTNLAVLKRFTKYEPVNAIAARRRIADRLLAAEHYLV